MISFTTVFLSAAVAVMRKMSCFHAGARAIVIAVGFIWMSFKIDSISSTVRSRSSSASSAFSSMSCGLATGQSANETSPSPPISFQRVSAVNGMNGASSRVQTEQSVWSSRLPAASFPSRRRYHFRSLSIPK